MKKMNNDYYPGPWDEDYYEDEGLAWDGGLCSPGRCGDCWMGDGLCRQEIDRLIELTDDFNERYVKADVHCPHCGLILTCYQIPTSEMWVWPGVWPDDENEYYPPIIALNIFAIMDAPKGEVHEPTPWQAHVFHHVWVGDGEYRSEKLIMLDRSSQESP